MIVNVDRMYISMVDYDIQRAVGIRSNFAILFCLLLSYMTLYKNHSVIFRFSVSNLFLLQWLFEGDRRNKNNSVAKQ